MNRLTGILLFFCLLPLVLVSQKPLAGIDSLAFIENSIRKVSKNVNFTVIPGPTFNATQKIGFAVLPMIVYNLDKKDTLSPPSSTAVLFYFDFNGSWITGARQNLYWNQNKWRAIVFTAYGQLKLRIFGVGRDTNVVSNDESNYVWGNQETFMLSLACYRKIVSHLYGGLEFNYTLNNMEGKDSSASAAMIRGGVPEGETDESRLTPAFVWDNRDNLFWSTKGYYAKLSCQLSSEFLFSTDDFYGLIGSVSGYHRLMKNSSRLSLAWCLYIQGSLGDVPYDQLSNYCRGDNVMGYTTGKYVNNGEVNGQVEVRYDIWKIIGAGAFVSLGKVFGSVRNFGQSIWLPSAGANLYLTLIPYRNIRMRLSCAVARRDWGFYIGIGQMF